MDQRQNFINLAATLVIIAAVALAALIFRNRHPNQVQVKHLPVAEGPTTKTVATPTGDHKVEPSFQTFPFPKIKLVDVPANKADSLRMHLPDGSDAVFAHYFINALDNSDTHLDRVHDTAKYFGNVSNDVVIETGREAMAYTKDLLSSHQYMVLTRWEKASEGRYYALIWVETAPNSWNYLAELLVRQGYARVAGDTTPLPNTKATADDYVLQLQAAAKYARQRKAGIWSKVKK